MGVFFLVYESLCRQWGVRDIQSKHDDMDMITMAKINVAGGLAGVVSWFTYPFDVIKSRIQTQSLSRPRYRGVFDCGRQMVQSEGAVVLFRGLFATILQAFPVSAAMFATYELILRFEGSSW